VGTYFTDFPNGLTGFKRWSNGGFVTLSFPGAQQTTPTSINDSGVIVGYYFPTSGLPSGFIYHSGQWATLNFPKSTNTMMVGIDNAGAIIGNALTPDKTSTPFLGREWHVQGNFGTRGSGEFDDPIRHQPKAWANFG
jgi:hypothetical protein